MSDEVIPAGGKSPGKAVLYDFLLPGAGHLYASGGESGLAYLISNLLIALLFPFLYVTILLNIGIWIAAMSTAGEVARKYNLRLQTRLAEAESKRQRDEDERQRQRLEAERSISGNDVAEELRKIANLRKMNLVSDQEATVQRQQFFERLLHRRTTQGVADFFTPLGPLFDAGTISQDDLDKLKAIHTQIVTTGQK